MPGQRKAACRAGALALLVFLGGWAMWRMLRFTDEFPGVGHTETAQARLWYPASALAAARPLPILVYFGGWPGGGIDNLELIQGLAAQGFVVVAWRGALADERPMDFSSVAAFRDTLQRGDARVRLLARHASGLLDSLEALNRGSPANRLTGRLDTSRVGILGYSFGGAVAAQAAWLDPRFKAVMNLDGWSFGDSAVQGIRQPYLYISDDTPMPSAADLVSADPTVRLTSQFNRDDSQRLLHNLAEHKGIFCSIAGTDHASFLDRGRRSRVRQWLGFPADRATRVQTIVRCYALAFFRSQLQGIGSALLSGPSPQFPEVRFPSAQTQS